MLIFYIGLTVSEYESARKKITHISIVSHHSWEKWSANWRKLFYLLQSLSDLEILDTRLISILILLHLPLHFP